MATPDLDAAVSRPFGPGGGASGDAVSTTASSAESTALAALRIEARDGQVGGGVGLVSAEGLGIDLASLLPEAVRQDFLTIFGEGGAGGLGTFAGASGNFSDNTLAVAPDDTLYIIGGGLDLEHGALVQVRVEGDANTPQLTAGWLLETTSGIASSPAVSPDGGTVFVGSGDKNLYAVDAGTGAQK